MGTGSTAPKQQSSLSLASILIAWAASTGPAYAAEPVGLSGYELSIGSSSGDVVRNVLFAGTTHPPCGCFTSQDDGTWVARVDRTGGSGLGGSVLILGGKLLVDTERTVNYRITGGTVTWPATLDTDIGCGAGVAVVAMTLSRGRTFSGCLDDTHLDPFKQPFVFPPRIWGTLQGRD